MSPLLAMFFSSAPDQDENLVFSRASVDALLDGMARKDIPVLLDVRTPEEFATGHLPGAINIPLTELPQRQRELDAYRGDDLWLVCRTGMRAERAARHLAREGFRPVHVEGGLRSLGEGRIAA